MGHGVSDRHMPERALERLPDIRLVRTGSTRFSAQRRDWLDGALDSVRRDGYAIVEDVMSGAVLARTRDAMYRVEERILADLGTQRLERAGELGVLRLMLRYDSHFCSLLELEEVLAVVDATVSPTAILHLQNGLMMPPSDGREAELFQTSFHRDFPRHLGGYVASVNTLLAVDEFTADNGATLLVPGSHQQAQLPDRDELEQAAVPALCPAGSMLVFDSTLWHAAGSNRSGRDRLAINQQFTRSFIKPQIDYVRALGDEAVLALRPRTQQLLGWYTRVVTSLDEYYRPAGERLYRGGQG
jgi:ectoine hydroxylase-related dioxygenase (phytanoyl-CoA dioxygenase family)